MTQGNLFLVTGTPGCGKSSILRAMSSQLGIQHAVLCYGDMLVRLRASPQSLHKDDIARSVNAPSELVAWDLLIMEQVIRERNHAHVFFELHASALTRHGYIPFSHDQLRLLQPTAIAFIEAPPETAVTWIEQDNAVDRRRHTTTQTEFRTFQDVNRVFSCAYAVTLGVPLQIISNRPGQLDLSATQLETWADTFTSS